MNDPVSPPPPATVPLTYTPALDGVRCFAVLMVAMYHSFLFSGGWIGVQVFFVLSGFLITALLLDAKVRYRDVFFRRFYYRRALRILPLYYAYLAATGIAFLLVAVPVEFPNLWGYLVTFTSNFTRLGAHDRGGEFFVHLWSLAVEEQYYLVWPILVFWLTPINLRRLVMGLILGVPLLRFEAGEWLAANGVAAEQVARVVNVLPMMQFDAFAVGSLVALVSASRRVANPARVGMAGVLLWLGVGALMLVGSTLAHVRVPLDSLGHHETTFGYYHVWGTTVTNVASAFILVAVLNGAFARLFENRLVVHVGKVSYGVYVLHLPLHNILIRALATDRHSSLVGLGIFTLYFAATVALATLSYRYFESTFLRWKDRLPRPRALAPAAAASTR